jgi:hypothetical protein
MGGRCRQGERCQIQPLTSGKLVFCLLLEPSDPGGLNLSSKRERGGGGTGLQLHVLEAGGSRQALTISSTGSRRRRPCVPSRAVRQSYPSPAQIFRRRAPVISPFPFLSTSFAPYPPHCYSLWCEAFGEKRQTCHEHTEGALLSATGAGRCR